MSFEQEFEEEYPSLNNHRNYKVMTPQKEEIIQRAYTERVINQCCKDNQRIKEAINKKLDFLEFTLNKAKEPTDELVNTLGCGVAKKMFEDLLKELRL